MEMSKNTRNLLLLRAENVSNGRHVFGFRQRDFQLRIFDLVFNVESYFDANTNDKLTKDFVSFGIVTKNFVFYAEPLENNKLMILYGNYGSHHLTYFSILEYNWRRHNYLILHDSKFLLCFPTISSNRLLFNQNQLILSNNKSQQINFYKHHKSSNELELRKVVDCNEFSCVYWHVNEEDKVLLTFKLDGEMCLLGKTSIEEESLGQTEYFSIDGFFEKEWFKPYHITAAWDFNKMFFVVRGSVAKKPYFMLFDLATLRFTQIQCDYSSFMTELSNGKRLITSESSFITNFNFHALRRTTKWPCRVNLVQPDSLSTLSLKTLTKTAMMQKMMRHTPQIFQNEHILNKHFMDAIAKMYKRSLSTPIRLSLRKRRIQGCECRNCKRSLIEVA